MIKPAPYAHSGSLKGCYSTAQSGALGWPAKTRHAPCQGATPSRTDPAFDPYRVGKMGEAPCYPGVKRRADEFDPFRVEDRESAYGLHTESRF